MLRVVQDNSIYYGGHRKFLVCLGLRAVGRPFRSIHMENPWDSYRRGRIPLGELLLTSPIDHVDRFFHRWVTEWFVRKGRNGIMVVHAGKPY